MHPLFRQHPRLLVAAAAGAATGACLPSAWSMISRLLAAWDCGVGLFLVLMFVWMMRTGPARLRSRYAEEDQSARLILAVVVCAALLSVAAILDPLATLRKVTGIEHDAHMALAAATLVGSWLLVPTVFTAHYAGMYYSTGGNEPPLEFPGTPNPDLWDFAYFSFTIAAACQTSDVSTTHGAVRKVVLAQTIVSFVFNLAILGFAINVTAGLIGN